MVTKSPTENVTPTSPMKQNGFGSIQMSEAHQINEYDAYLDSASRSSGELGDTEIKHNSTPQRHSRCFRYSPETTDYDSNCGDLDSLSGDYNTTTNYPAFARHYTSMPVLEDGLSSGHASDTENNNPTTIAVLMADKKPTETVIEPPPLQLRAQSIVDSPIKRSPIMQKLDEFLLNTNNSVRSEVKAAEASEMPQSITSSTIFKNTDPELESLYSINMVQMTPPPPAPAPHRKASVAGLDANVPDIQAALKDIRSTLKRTKTYPTQQDNHLLSEAIASPISTSPVWIPSYRCRENIPESTELDALHEKSASGEEEELDTDLETDRLLGHQRVDDQGFYDENSKWSERKGRFGAATLSKLSPKVPKSNSTSLLRQGINSLLPSTPEITSTVTNLKSPNNNLVDLVSGNSNLSPQSGGGGMQNVSSPEHIDSGGSGDQDKHQDLINESPSGSNASTKDGDKKKKSKNKEVLIEGVLFRARYLGSTQLVCEGQPTKSTRMMQAEEAVSRIKAPDGENQPSTEVDLFISTEKIMVLNTDLKEIMMDHALRTISYIADIGDLVVLMARRRFVPQDMDDGPKPNRTPKMICHVFESDEAQFIAQSIGQAFQVAYMEFLKANGIEDHSFVKEMDYQEVLNSQEIFGDELEIFAKKELQKEVVVPKAKGEILGVVIVESGWGSMLPTVVIANLLSSGAAARCGQLNIGDQIIAINGLSLVGLPLSTCQTYIKNTKTQTVVKFTVVPCPPVVEVKIKRPNTKYQLGFSVQNGVICSLLRGGIAERGGVRVGHRIIEINNQSVVAVPHEKIVNLLATSVGETVVKFTVVPCPPVVEVKIKRPNTKYQLGFSVQNGVICSLLRGGIAERGGVRVGHRIIEINNQSVVAVPHEKIDGLSSFGTAKHPIRGISNTKQTTRPELHQINSIASERYLWEMRRRTPNTTPASTVLNSPDLTENESRHGYHHHHHHQYPIKLGRSPVSHADSASPVTPPGGAAVVTEGEMVVFDDIGESWNGGRMILDSPTISDTEGAAAPRQESEPSPGVNNRVTKVIGNLPIAEYEGSPRRFGNIQYDSPVNRAGRNVLASPALFPPRPGFPQRVVPSPNAASYEDIPPPDDAKPATTFDYLYEFSETRKVLEEFFKCPDDDGERAKSSSSDFTPHGYHNQLDSIQDHSYIGQRLAQKTQETQSPTRRIREEEFDHNDIELYLDSGSRSSGELADTELEHNVRRHSRNFTLSPETTDYDSNCGDLDSLSNDINGIVPDFNRLYTSMPVLEDGLSSGHASDTENNNPGHGADLARARVITGGNFIEQTASPKRCVIEGSQEHEVSQNSVSKDTRPFSTPPPPPPQVLTQDVQAALKDIRTTLQRTKTLPAATNAPPAVDRTAPKSTVEKVKDTESPVWVPRHHNNAASRESLSSEHPSKGMSAEDEEADTDLETDRLLGQQRLDDQGFYEDKGMWKGKLVRSPSSSKSPPSGQLAQSTIRQGVGTALSPTSPISGGSGGRISPATLADKSPTDSISSKKDDSRKGKSRNKEDLLDPAVLIEGVLFRARYLGSTQLVCEGQPTKSTRMIQAEEAVSRIKAPEGENQPSTEVDLFISTEKIMVLNTDLKEIMMDHALRTISYIADIGDLVVLMARRRFVPQDMDDGPKPNRTPKMICHVFESDEAQFIAQGGIAERGGVRVGHRIIEINNQSVVAVPHEKIVNLLATSVGEILMKTMPTSMFRLLTGQENPIYI
uniref:Protein lin-10 n=2 Tax=Lutzomyia longipalpis TaxID=7200 RepID=A0A1B0CGW4_LUTLO